MKTVIVTPKLQARLYEEDFIDPYLNVSAWLRAVYHGEMRIYVGADCDYAIDFEDEKHYTYFILKYNEHL